MNVTYFGSEKELGLLSISKDNLGNIILKPSNTISFGSKITQVKNGVKKTFQGDSKSIILLASDKKKNLESIRLSDFVSKIDSLVFKGCENLCSVEYEGFVYNDAVELVNRLTECNIKCDLSAFKDTSLYETINGSIIVYTSSNDEIITPNSPEGFGAKITTNIYNMKQGKITFDGSINCIPENAFIHCSNLQSIEIPNGVETISRNAFNGCISLKNIEFPTSVKTIKQGAFLHCTLHALEISNNIKEIGIETDNNYELYNGEILPVYKYTTAVFDGTFIENLSYDSPSPISYFEIEGYTKESIFNAPLRNLKKLILGPNITDIRGLRLNRELNSVTFCDEIYTNYYDLVNALKDNEILFEEQTFKELGLDMTLKPSEEPETFGSQIIYTSTDEQVITPNTTEGWGANLVSNTYEE